MLSVCRGVLVRLLGTLVILSCIAQIYFQFQLRDLGRSTAASAPNLDDSTVGSAGNSTLGFEKIMYINLADRYDYDDAITIQSSIAGIETEKFLAVHGSNIPASNKGFPPSSYQEDGVHTPLNGGELACRRSHANLWSRMIKENWKTLLILESDAAWDANIRKINQRLAVALAKLQRQNGSTGPDAKSDVHSEQAPYAGPTPDDPFDSESWDIISLGSCDNGGQKNDQNYLIYQDPDAPLRGPSWRQNTLYEERVVREAGYLVCTTAYAVSQRGARKLLMGQSLDSNTPIDITIANMIDSGDVKGYTVWPPTFYTWVYADGTGGEGQGSDIQTYKQHKPDPEVWKEVHESKSIWRLKYSYKDWPLRNDPFKLYGEALFPRLSERDSQDETRPGTQQTIPRDDTDEATTEASKNSTEGESTN